MRDTTRQARVEENSPRRRVSRRQRNNNINANDVDIDALLKEGSSNEEDTNLESIFRRPVANPFSTAEEAERIAAEEAELEELSKADNSRIYTTGYSIHLLTPYILLIAGICVGLVAVDAYLFNIIEFLSEDMRYKVSGYGLLILVFSIITYLFVKKIIEYTSFEMVVTKYRIIQGSKRTTAKNEIPYYSIQEFINDRGLFGRFFNYGDLALYLTTRRTISFENLHGAQYVYDIIERLKYGSNSGDSEDDQIYAMINGAEKIETLNKQREGDPDSLDLDINFADLGFTEEELLEMRNLSSSPKSSASTTSSPVSSLRSQRSSRSLRSSRRNEEASSDAKEGGLISSRTRQASRTRRSRR